MNCQNLFQINKSSKTALISDVYIKFQHISFSSLLSDTHVPIEINLENQGKNSKHNHKTSEIFTI